MPKKIHLGIDFSFTHTDGRWRTPGSWGHRIYPDLTMFEDLARNLSVPHALGMTTVLVVPPATKQIVREGWEMEGRDAAHVDHVTDDLTRFLCTCRI